MVLTVKDLPNGQRGWRVSMDIEANLKTYLRQRNPTGRYTSFDYCYNHFQLHREQGRLSELVTGPNLSLSCLHLAFYLASWGMLRASSVLLQRSLKHYVPVIQVIASSPAEIWNVDADCYDEANCRLVFEMARQIRAALPDGASDILVTKIMLGVFGCVPAFDAYFKKGFGCLDIRQESAPARREVLRRQCGRDRSALCPHARVRYRHRVHAQVHARQGHRHDLLYRGRRVTDRTS